MKAPRLFLFQNGGEKYAIYPTRGCSQSARNGFTDLSAQLRAAGAGAYLRHLISGLVPRDAPPPDYFSIMRELHGIGNNLNQIAQKAHTQNVVDVQRYDAAVRQFEAAVRKITEAVVSPQPIAIVLSISHISSCATICGK